MTDAGGGLWARGVAALIRQRVVVALLTLGLVGLGAYVAPFEVFDVGVPRDPVPVDALPNLGENQQIVFTEWPGASPQDVDDQVTYPLTTALLGLGGVRTVRSSSAFGFSSVYVIFEDDVPFETSRTRLLEKLAALPAGLLPDGVAPTLGPDATALGQVFWYTLEGQAPDGQVVGGWDLDELREIQDWTVRYALQAVPGVAEVASVGGHLRELQVDVDPDALRAHDVTLAQVVAAVRESNLDVGGRTLEVNGVEYLVRGLGRVEDLEDLSEAVVVTRDRTPIRVRDVASVHLGPGLRRGLLDDAGAPAVGGVVVSRHGENPREVLAGVKARLAELAPSLPSRSLADGTVSQVRVVPFYDRSELVDETLDTLSSALWQQVLVALLVVLVMLRDGRSALLIGATLPLGVLGTFVVMKITGVTANLMALGGIAIAIGTMVDLGIVLVENIVQHGEEEGVTAESVSRATAEVAPAVITSVLTTIVSFLPVFGLTAGELRLFGPLALTKTFAMAVAVAVAVLLLPVAAWALLRVRLPEVSPAVARALRWSAVAVLGLLLVGAWKPLGEGVSFLGNLAFVAGVVGGVLWVFSAFERVYPRLLASVLAARRRFLLLPAALVVLGLTAWLGFDRVAGFLPSSVRELTPVSRVAEAFPGLGREHLPPFDEGSFLYMPSTLPHASTAQVIDGLQAMDAAIAQIPEVDRVVGKAGRVDSALDPAPLAMIETMITHLPEYGRDAEGNWVRQWRDEIETPQDLWDEIARVAAVPGFSGAPKLMPIQTRQVMLQSGMRAPLGVQVTGPSLEALERAGEQVEAVLRGEPAVRAETVFAERVVGKPYLELVLDREALGRHGLSTASVLRTFRVAVGGETVGRTVEGRARHAIRVRYAREARDHVEALGEVLVRTPAGADVPLRELGELVYARGPAMLKSEDTFLTSYVLFDRQPQLSDLEAVEAAQAALDQARAQGRLDLPPGVQLRFAGAYQQQLASEARLKLLLPVALLLIVVLLQLQFRRAATTLIIGSGAVVAASGGFLLLWLYGQPWFLWLPGVGDGLREVFGVQTTHLSVAVWVGFIALLGLATDDGVVMSTYLHQRFAAAPTTTVEEVRARTLEAGLRRVRPCLMTTATTLLALLPVISSRGRGADVMVALALPLLGGMSVALITLFVVPVLHCSMEERGLERTGSDRLR